MINGSSHENNPSLQVFLWPCLFESGRAAGSCDAIGNVRFICGVNSAEDIVAVPESEWVVASGVRAPGALELVNTRDDETVIGLLPGHKLQSRFDARTYGSCPGPLDVGAEGERFRPHGLNIVRGRNTVHKFYVVHHGGREAIEVFDIDVCGKVPALTWIDVSSRPRQ